MIIDWILLEYMTVCMQKYKQVITFITICIMYSHQEFNLESIHVKKINFI